MPNNRASGDRPNLCYALVIWAILAFLGLPGTKAQAQELPPSDLELAASYCISVNHGLLQETTALWSDFMKLCEAEAQQNPTVNAACRHTLSLPNPVDALQDNIRRLSLYVLSKGLAQTGRRNATRAARAAMEMGRLDMEKLSRLTAEPRFMQCIKSCLFTTNSDGCSAACRTANGMTDFDQRIARCENIIKQLPF